MSYSPIGAPYDEVWEATVAPSRASASPHASPHAGHAAPAAHTCSGSVAEIVQCLLAHERWRAAQRAAARSEHGYALRAHSPYYRGAYRGGGAVAYSADALDLFDEDAPLPPPAPLPAPLPLSTMFEPIVCVSPATLFLILLVGAIFGALTATWTRKSDRPVK